MQSNHSKSVFMKLSRVSFKYIWAKNRPDNFDKKR